MTKHQLAQELRARQYAYGEVEPHIIDALSDQDIIECYITCSDCGHQQVRGKELEYAITMAHNSDEFFDLCDRLGQGHGHA
jgi:hypothetical protein